MLSQQAQNTPCWAATSVPHSVQPWAAAPPPYTAIRDPFPDLFWSTYARAHRRGGAKQPPCCAHGPSMCRSCLSIPSWAPSELIWVGGAVKRSHMLLLLHPKTPSRHWLSGVCMCMYVNVSVCMCKYWMYQYVWPVWTNKRYIYCHFFLLCNSTCGWVAHLVTYDLAGGSSNPRKGYGGFVEMSLFSGLQFWAELPGQQILFVISMPRTRYIQINTYMPIYMHIHN